jgi:hypothetical protein
MTPSLRQWAISGLIGLIALLSCPFLIYDTLRLSYLTPIDYNEGWNVVNTSRLLHGGPLYVPIHDLPITPVGYPPLSFFIVGAVSKFTGSILFSGRAVSLLSFLTVGYLIFRTIQASTSETLSALLGALLWLAILLRFAGGYIGMEDPQMLAHVFSTSAIYLYAKWGDNLDIRKICSLALLSCLALFTKHLLIAVPITLALTLLCLNRKACLLFILAGLSIASVLLCSSRLYGGENLWSNFLDLHRPTSLLRSIDIISDLFIERFLLVLFLPFFLLCFIYQRKNIFMFLYFVISFLIGSIAARGIGVDRNAWFDFFIASAIIFGVFATYMQNVIRELETGHSTKVYSFLAGSMILLGLVANEFVLARYVSPDGILEPLTISKIRLLQATFILAGLVLLSRGKIAFLAHRLLIRSGLDSQAAESRRLKILWASMLTYGVLAAVLLPLTSELKDELEEVLDYSRLKRQAEAYQNDIKLLQSIPGPALYEDILMGFEANKEFLVDPDNSTMMILANRWPEELLVDRIRDHYFTVIVLNFNVGERIRHLNESEKKPARPEASLTHSWTNNTVKAIDTNYEMFSIGQSGVYFYCERRREGREYKIKLGE